MDSLNRELQRWRQLGKSFQPAVTGRNQEPRRYEIHELKTIEPYFQAVASGSKCFELRKMDRDYRLGDHLVLRRYDAERKVYLSGTVTARITCVLEDFPGLEKGYGILGIKVLNFDKAEEAIAP